MLNRFKRDSQLVISVRKNLKRKRKGWKETSDSRKKKEGTREREREKPATVKFSRRVAIVVNSFIDFAPLEAPHPPLQMHPDYSFTSQPECTYLYIRTTHVRFRSPTNISPLSPPASLTRYIPPPISPSISLLDPPPFRDPNPPH